MAKTKKKSKNSGLRSGLNFKNKYFILIVLVVAAVGGLFAYKSFAASNFYNVTIQTFSPPCPSDPWSCTYLDASAGLPSNFAGPTCWQTVNVGVGQTKYVWNFHDPASSVYRHYGLGVFDNWNIRPADGDSITGSETRQFTFPVNNGKSHVVLGTRRITVVSHGVKVLRAVKFVNQSSSSLNNYPVVVRVNC